MLAGAACRRAARRLHDAARRAMHSGVAAASEGGGAAATASLLLRFSAAAYVVQMHVFNSTMCVGPSMLPTFNVRGDVLITEYVSPRLGLVFAGDVVVATKPNDVTVSVIKRIRAVAGEEIAVRRREGGGVRRVRVPEGHVWLEGDNPRQSTDSREYGPVPVALLRGKIVARFWPPRQACFVKHGVVDHLAGEVDARR